MKQRFKFNALVLAVATVVAGIDYAAGTVLPIYGEDRKITEADAGLLLNSGKALQATEANIKKVKAKVKATVEAAERDVKNQQRARASAEKNAAAAAKSAAEAVEVARAALEKAEEALAAVAELAAAVFAEPSAESETVADSADKE